MTEQLLMDMSEIEKKEPERKPNPVWSRLNKLEEQVKILSHKIETIEKSLRRGR